MSQTPKPTFILDTSFLLHLSRFDAFFNEMRKEGKLRPDPFPAEKTPLQGLEYLAQRGCHFVIPNEVLREITQNKGGDWGLGLDANGAPYLDVESLRRIKYDDNRIWGKQLVNYLLARHKEGGVQCFGSAEEYFKAPPKETACFAIVSDLHSLTSGNGFQDGDAFAKRNRSAQHHKQQMGLKDDRLVKGGKAQSGDEEILKIKDYFSTAPYDKSYNINLCLLSDDGDLLDKFQPTTQEIRRACPKPMFESTNILSYLDLLVQSGFLPAGVNPKLLRGAFEQFRVASSSQGAHFPTQPNDLTKMIDYAGLNKSAAATTVGNIHNLGQVGNGRAQHPLIATHQDGGRTD
jgi:hypothetical protein